MNGGKVLSFSSSAKAELCQTRLENKASAVAEAYGVLLYCNTFSAKEIRIITASDEFGKRLPKLFKKAFDLNFDVLPDQAIGNSSKKSYVINDPKKISAIFNSFDIDVDSVLSQHINRGIIEEDNEKTAFLRGAFLAGGSCTDPLKNYHLELCTAHYSVSREAYSLLLEMDFSPKEANRSGTHLVYFKKSEAIEDFFTRLGAPVSAMDVMNAKVEKEMRNVINRKVNCDSANADKIVAAAQEQLNAIKFIDREFGLESLPDKLHETALLRITNPGASISDLAKLAIPPVSKSCLNHRLKKLVSLAEEKSSQSNS